VIPGAGSGLALVAALVLGLRHATDADHLTAVATLALGEERPGAGRAARLGAAWGAGHAVTLLAAGLPAILLGRRLPDSWHRIAEVAVGALISALAVRLLLRWRRGAFHAHPHRHGAEVHCHPHAHERAHEVAYEVARELSPAATAAPAAATAAAARPVVHHHHHAEKLGRTPLASFGIGLVHGVGGSAAAGVLLVASFPTPAAAGLGLVVFAAATALAMSLATALVGATLARSRSWGRLETAVPVLGVASLAFGVWYALSSLLPAVS
jgi:hypothetical protein